MVKMPNQYPFWKDREIAYRSFEADRYRIELEELKKKTSNIKCPNCGHIFDCAKDLATNR
jgi:DNA-directed RNA polymerase subunit RPC12/RpoP